MQAGQQSTPYRAVALMGPVAHPVTVFEGLYGAAQFQAYYAEAQANGYANIVTPWGQTQATSLEWFNETMAANPVGDIEYFKGRVLVVWGEAETTIPYAEAEAYMAVTEDSAKSNALVTIPGADHGYGFYSSQPEVDAMLHGALVAFFKKALK